MVPELFHGELCSTAFCVLRAKSEILSNSFLYYWLQQDIFIEEISKLQRGASYPAVTDSNVKKQKIPCPALPEQEEIGELLNQLDRKIEFAENKKKHLQDLFKTILQFLMTGQVRVKDIKFTNETREEL